MTYIDTTPVHAPPSVEVMEHAGVPRNLVDRALGRLFLLLCERYDLDPALRQVEVINSGGQLQVYITADGYRHIALASGDLDGITIPDASEGEHGWRAHVQVWRKGCGHPFDGRAGAGFDEKNDDPEALAITRATRRALRNAFDPVRVEGEYAELLRDSEVEVDAPQGGDPEAGTGAPPPDPPPAEAARAEPRPQANPAPGPPLRQRPDHARQRAARERYNMLGEEQRRIFRRQYDIADLAVPWPDEALDALLGTGPIEGTP